MLLICNYYYYVINFIIFHEFEGDVNAAFKAKAKNT